MKCQVTSRPAQRLDLRHRFLDVAFAEVALTRVETLPQCRRSSCCLLTATIVTLFARGASDAARATRSTIFRQMVRDFSHALPRPLAILWNALW